MANKKTTEVATATSAGLMLGQNDIPAMLAKVNDQIKAIKGGMPKEAKTTGELPGFGKIKDIKTVSDLIKAHSAVVNRAAMYKASAAAILPEGIKTPPFILEGSSESAWVTDISSRIVDVAHKASLDKLNKVKTMLESNLSAEAKLAKDLGDIANLLSED